jgi:hypothetical protein
MGSGVEAVEAAQVIVRAVIWSKKMVATEKK